MLDLLTTRSVLPNPGHPLNVGLELWYYGLPDPATGWGGNTWRDLSGRQRDSIAYNNLDAGDWSAQGHHPSVGAMDLPSTPVSWVDTGRQDLTATNGTVACWAMRRTLSSDAFLVNDFTTGSYLYLRVKSTGVVEFQVGSWVATSATGLFTANTWHHCVGTWSASNTAVYIDGKLADDFGFGAGGWSPNSNMLIGGVDSPSWAGSIWNGPVSDVRFYKRQMQASEVRQLYIESRAGYPTSLTRAPLPIPHTAGGGGGGVFAPYYYTNLLAG